jgi:predicted ATPase
MLSSTTSSSPIRTAAAFSVADLPLHAADAALLGVLASRTGGFVSDDEIAATSACSWRTVPDHAHKRLGTINEVLAKHFDAGHFVMHVPGVGYSLTVPSVRSRLPAAVCDTAGRTRLPPLRSRVVGRQGDLAAITASARQSRLLTLFGAGGVGKTTLAVAAAQQMAGSFADGVFFVDLSPLTCAEAIAPAVAAALRMPPAAGAGPQDIAGFLRTRVVLLVVDNCEHVVDGAAALCDAIHRAAPRTCILATSRETLRCAGESVHRVRSLATPGPAEALTSEKALAFAAVQLFVDRLAERMPGFVLKNNDAATAAELCRRLDGLPLAIELAAGFAQRMDLRDMLLLLDAPLAMRAADAPTARHESLGHLLHWSYELLGATERRVFERLCLFRGHFTMESAKAVAGADGVARDDVPRTIIALAAKSLLAVEPTPEGPPRFRLLETTRRFASARLRAGSDYDTSAARHAEDVRQLLEAVERDWTNLSPVQWYASCGTLLDDLRGAVDWAFSENGDSVMGARLAVAGAPLAFVFSLWGEFAGWFARAIAAVDAGHPIDAELESRLRRTYGTLLALTRGPGDDMSENYEAALEKARETTGAVAAWALDGVWMSAYISGDYPRALPLAQECAALARAGGDPVAIVRTRRMLSQSLYAMADFPAAADLAESLISDPNFSTRQSHWSAIDPRISARVVLARVRWLQGRPSRAATLLAEALAMCKYEASESDAHVLAWGALPLHLWNGDLDAASGCMGRLEEVCAGGRHPYWGSWREPFALAIRGARGETVLRTELEATKDNLQIDMLGTLGHMQEVVFDRAERGMAPWCAAEIFRARGEQLLRGDPTASVEGEDLIRRGLLIAREQGSLAWELRCSISLARLWLDRRMRAEAGELLSEVYARFPEGENTADLAKARALLAQLAGGRRGLR